MSMRIGLLTLVLLAMPTASQASNDVTGTQPEPREILIRAVPVLVHTF